MPVLVVYAFNCMFEVRSGVFAVPADLMKVMKETFSVPEEKECRVWHKYMLSTYDLLSKLDESIQDAGLYTNQVCVHARMRVCVCVCMFAYVQAVCACVCVCACLCMCVCVCVFM